MSKRVFKTRTFDRWARKVLADDELCVAASEIEQGRYEADLGSGLCKKRIARVGQGKSGALRTLVAKRHVGALFFIAGHEKSDPGTDFTAREESGARIVGEALQRADAATLDRMKLAGALKEICDG